ncbi:hypothetical protein ZWY2020_032072 [Hordeum vulgare]|nr:hypothetical protein ZWY2020_032072 [Hordeum vulgare]
MERCERSSALRTSAEAEPSADGNGKSDIRSDQADEESNILKNVFDAQGVHSAVNHDAIMSANDDLKLRLEAEASQSWCCRGAIHGKFGSTLNTQLVSCSQPSEGSSSSSRVQSLPVGALHGKALSSAELLAKMHGTREGAASDAVEYQLSLGSASNQRPGSTSLTEHFKNCIQPKDMLVFKNLAKGPKRRDVGAEARVWVDLQL